MLLTACLILFSILTGRYLAAVKKSHEGPTITSPEYLKKYPQNTADTISLQWSYKHFDEIKSPIISPDGKFILFLTTMNDKQTLVCLNSEGEKKWSYSDFKRIDAPPHIKLRNNFILVYWACPPGNVEDLRQGQHWSFYVFNIEGKLLWDKTVWGIPHFTDSGKTILVSTYTRTLYEGDKDLKNEKCVDPIVRIAGGGDALDYDVRGKSLRCDAPTGKCSEISLRGIEDISENSSYLLTSCIGKTALYNKSYKALFDTKDSGYARLSPDNTYFVIRKHKKGVSHDEVIVHDMQGSLLWRKPFPRYFPNWEGIQRSDEGVVPLLNGYLGVITAKYNEHTGMISNMDVTLYITDPAGNIVKKIMRVDDFLVDIVAASSRTEYIYVVGIAQKDREVRGSLGIKTTHHVNRLYRIDYKGKVLGRSGEIIGLSEMSMLAPADASDAVIAATRWTLYYFKRNPQ
ncbi:MAG: hypothetical protein MUP30_03160 [Deltaproteobacteria bacterium]|nr:hypothetical protein [Deltaproteobacteria bacterium]